MSRRRWLIPLAALGGVLLYRNLRRGAMHRRPQNGHTCSMPSAAVYDAFSSLLLGEFYRKAACDVAASCSTGALLDVGCGPGHLAVQLGTIAPGLSITGLDADPAMIGRARDRAARAGLTSRVRFDVGDAAALPYPEGAFDCAVSTYSLHHWQDPKHGLNEVYRVLKPGGEAAIYDIPDWLQRLFHHGEGRLEAVAMASTFGGGLVKTFKWPGPLPSTKLLLLRRPRPTGP